MRPEALELAAAERRRPTWGMALIYPDQGGWTVEEYLDLDVGRHVDFEVGHLEFHTMPNRRHQRILLYLLRAIDAYAERHGGQALMAPFPVQLWPEKFRQPDAVYMKAEHAHRCHEAYWQGADLVMQVVSESNRRLDTRTKRAEYARARIPEYWLVDPKAGTITVLRWRGGAYGVHGTFAKRQTAVSRLLPGFAVDVSAALSAR
ncbi:MAG: Uma2 family endonuclease [Planctomycetes bacterium]|nr:Uma2 family endonuclease [Planctomycetota bacterium]